MAKRTTREERIRNLVSDLQAATTEVVNREHELIAAKTRLSDAKVRRDSINAKLVGELWPATRKKGAKQ